MRSLTSLFLVALLACNSANLPTSPATPPTPPSQPPVNPPTIVRPSAADVMGRFTRGNPGYPVVVSMHAAPSLVDTTVIAPPDTVAYQFPVGYDSLWNGTVTVTFCPRSWNATAGESDQCLTLADTAVSGQVLPHQFNINAGTKPTDFNWALAASDSLNRQGQRVDYYVAVRDSTGQLAQAVWVVLTH